MEPVALGPLRHHCYACGKCCHGHQVTLIDAEEVARIERMGADLGVDRPVVDGAVRFEAGACVFLGEDRLCRIHKAHGLHAKPLRCQEYPVRMIRTEGELRVGVDPTCVNTWRSWRDGEELDLVTIVRDRHWPEAERRLEGALLQAARPGATVGGLLRALGGAPAGPDLPPGFAHRWIRRLKEADISRFLLHPEVGWGLRQPVEHLIDAVRAFEPEHPPAWPALDREQEDFTLEILRRSIFLRNAPLLPGTFGITVLTLGGAVVLGWADPDPVRFGEGLSAWARCIEFRAFWLRLLPDPTTAGWLVHGKVGS